jgi:hypothetical protein
MTDTTTQPESELPPATNVIAALARVEAEVGGIEKRRGGEGGISYPFRGIDAIAQAAQPLLGKHGVVIVPELREQRIVDITVNNKPWTDTFVEVQWSVYGPGGVDDKIVAYTSGWGRDNADKGINKAMTGAFKNLLLRILCIGDPQDDTDGHTHERDDGRGRPADSGPDENIELFERVKAAKGTAAEETLKELAARHERKLSAKAFAEDHDWRDAVRVVLDAVTEEQAPPPGVDAETGEVLDAEHAAEIDALMDGLDALEATDAATIEIQRVAANADKYLTREAFIADRDWATEVAQILLEHQGS